MALSGATVFEIQSLADAGNVGSGGFNPNNANMLTDLATDTNTANISAVVVSSASYNFAAGDVNAWLYIKTGTNWQAGWYQIISSDGVKATLSAAAGASTVRIVQNNRYQASTVTGVTTNNSATLTGGTFTIDYSQQASKTLQVTDVSSLGASTTLSSLTQGGFHKAMVGNLIHQITTGTGAHGLLAWFEIVSVTDTNNLITDRTSNDGTASAACTCNIGGALSLASGTAGRTDDDVFELAVTGATASTRYFVQGGSSITYTLGTTVNMGVTSNTAWPLIVEGYGSVRGDRPTGATRPTLATAGNNITVGIGWNVLNIQATGTASVVLDMQTNAFVIGCKGTNSSTTANRIAIRVIGGTGHAISCETISYRGHGLEIVGGMAEGCYSHDSDLNFTTTSSGGGYFVNCIGAGAVTTCFAIGSGQTSSSVYQCTAYGTAAKTGIGISGSTATYLDVRSTIIYGFTTGGSSGSTQTCMMSDYNTYFNNTADVSSAAQWQKGANDIAVDPSFTSVAEKTGTNASTSGSVLTDSGATFPTFVPGQDFLFVTGGGTTAGIYGIVSNTGTTITTDIALGTHASGVTYRVRYLHNFLPTGSI